MMDAESQAPTTQQKGWCSYIGEFCYACFFTSSEEGAAKFVRFFNFANATLLFLTGLFSLLTITNVLSVTFYFMCFYVMFFGLILCCFEMRFAWAEKRVRASFGFLYTFLGRTIFLLFLASFCFGLMGSDYTLGLAMGVLTALNALFNMVIMYRYGKIFQDPSSLYGTAENTTSNYLRQNPELATGALNMGISAARENPQVMRQGLAYAASNPEVARQGLAYAQNNPADARALAQGAYQGSSNYA